MVNMAELELKMEVSEDMRAASMTASRSPLSPTGNVSVTNLMKAMLLQPDLKYQCFCFSASDHLLGNHIMSVVGQIWYRVTSHLAELGWVAVDFGYFSVCSILTGLKRVCVLTHEFLFARKTRRLE